MKSKKMIIIGIILAILILLVPIPMRLKDGGSIEYKALLYSITKVHRLNNESTTGYEDGIEIKILGMKIYNNVEFEKQDVHTDTENVTSNNEEASNIDNTTQVPEINNQTETNKPTETNNQTETNKPTETNNQTEMNKPTETKPSNTQSTNEEYKLCAKCNKIRVSGNLYCNDCKCSLTNCKNMKSGNSDRYCSEHICLKSGCLGYKEEGSLYCQSHNCDGSYCKEAQSEGSRYCLQHKCTECAKQKEQGSNFCSTHNCRWGSCKEAQTNNSGYCISHKCNQTSCSNPKQSSGNYCSNHDCKSCMGDRFGDSFYCIKHKCSVGGCKNPVQLTTGGVGYCNNHKPN